MSGAAPRLAPTLAGLVAPETAAGFLERHWRRCAFHAPGSPERLGPVWSAMGASDVASLFAQSRQFAAGGKAASSRSEALAAFERGGTTLYFRMREDFALCRWTEAIAHALGELPIGVTSFFAVRGGGGSAPHLDWNENFTIQLRGVKRWRVAPAAAAFLSHPVTNWTMGEPPPPYADRDRVPDAMPSDASEHVLTPGAVLYVPRGFLHEVAASGAEESLSLNLSVPPTPWATLLCSLLSNRLHGEPALRAAVTGAFGSGWGRDQALAQLPAMLAALGREAAGLEADLRAALEDPERLADYLARRGHPRI